MAGVKRRLLIGGGVLAGGAGLLLYKAFPKFFWKDLANDAIRGVPPAPLVPDPSKWPDTGLHAAWLGHATVLLKIDGYTILTDPVLHNRIGIDARIATIGMKRLFGPALSVESLPKIDLIVSSHAHMDHLDLATMRDLEAKDRDVVMAKSTSDLIRADRYRKVTEVGWGERTQIGPVAIQGLEVKHWGARMRSDTYRGYNGYRIEVGRWKILFAGDTADTDAFRRQRSGDVDLALMPIGAYNPWIFAHCDPEQAWRMANDFGAAAILPIHHRTFKLSQEPASEPLERLLNAAGNSADRVVVRQIGGEAHFS